MHASLDVERRNGYLIVNVWFVDDDGRSLSRSDEGGEYRDVIARAQADPESTSLYGFDCERAVVRLNYNEYDADELREIASTLAKIDRKLAKLNERFGYAYNFSDFALRLCDAVGAQGWIDDNGRKLPLSELKDKIERVFREYKGQ